MNTDLVWQHSQAEGIDRLVLLAIAHAAEDDGTVTMHVRTIADKAHIADRTVQRSIARLAELGELDVTLGRGRKRGSTYRVLISEEQERADETRPPGRDIVSPFRGDSLSPASPARPAWRRLLGVPNNGNGAA